MKQTVPIISLNKVKKHVKKIPRIVGVSSDLDYSGALHFELKWFCKKVHEI